MDPSNYKVPKRQPINYGPKIKPLTPVSKPAYSATRPIIKPVSPQLNHSQQPSSVASAQKSTTTQKYIAPTPVVDLPQPQPTQPYPKAEATYIAPVSAKKQLKPRRLLKKALIVLIVIILLGLLAGGGYFGFKKYQDSKRQPEANNSNNIGVANGANSSTQGNVNPILGADYIVYGTKQGSLFVTNKSDYQKDLNAAVIKIVAKSTYPNDNREITISQQKVASNFGTDIEGLKKMADSIGPNTSLATNNGTSYIITGNATGLAAIGATLISVRTSASLALAEWQQIFNDLQPVQI